MSKQPCRKDTVKALLPEGVIAIDGKTMRGSHQRKKGLKGLHVVSAWSCENEMSLCQVKVSDKSNEITAIPVLLEQEMMMASQAMYKDHMIPRVMLQEF